MENKANFINRRANRIGVNQINRIQNKSIPSANPSESIIQSSSENSNIITTIILFVLLISIICVIYFYGNDIYNFINSFIKNESTYYVVQDEESNSNLDKIKCKSGCVKGKCNKNDDKNGCKEDEDCDLCLDKDGSIYGAAPNKKGDEKLKAYEEEDIMQNKRIKELEEMIKDRNKQINDLNKYIDYLNKNKDKINKDKVNEIYEEENKNFIVKVNYS